MKMSFHESGDWHNASSHKTYYEQVQDHIPCAKNRFLDTWHRPPDIAPGLTLAARIITPAAAVSRSISDKAGSKIFWIPMAPIGKAVEVFVMLTKTPLEPGQWPGSRSMQSSLIGSLPLHNGETVWAVHAHCDAPDFSSIPSIAGQLMRGKGRADLHGDGIRGLLFADNLDGSKAIYDLAVDGLPDGPQEG
jgi:hypothetical protein